MKDKKELKKHISNEELALSIKQGNNEAFKTLYKLHFKEFCIYACGFVNDTDLAKEIVQDSIIKIWENKERIDLNKNLISYIYTIIKNFSLNWLKHKQIENKYVDNYVKTNGTHLTEPFEKLIIQELLEEIYYAINKLSTKTRYIFLLSKNEGLKYSEIAIKLNISVKTVEYHISKALNSLADSLKDYIVIIFIFWFTKLFY